MSADDVTPTVPAIPLRARQKHKERTKKRADGGSRWLTRRETPPFGANEEAFFRAGDAPAPDAPSVGADAPATEAAPTLEDRSEPRALASEEEDSDQAADAAARRARRRRARLVVAAVVASSSLALAIAVTRPRAEPVRAPAAVAVAAARPATRFDPPPVAIEPPEIAAPEPSAAEVREEARALLSRREITGAIAAARRAVDADPEDATGWLILGAAQMEARLASDARESFRACAKLAKVGPVAECRAFLR